MSGPQDVANLRFWRDTISTHGAAVQNRSEIEAKAFNRSRQQNRLNF